MDKSKHFLDNRFSDSWFLCWMIRW